MMPAFGRGLIVLFLLAFLQVFHPPLLVSGAVVETWLYLRQGIVAPDGFPRLGITVNGTMPGPPIVAKVGDTLKVHVHNQMVVATTIHWHGILQTDSYFMDGTAMITQCPIPPSQSFTYEFKVDEPGTYFYHAHLGGQNADGLLGPLIVRYPNDPAILGYDEEYTVFIQDWFHADAMTIDIMKSKGWVNGLTMDAGLINGKGHFNCSDYRPPSGSTPFQCSSDSTLASSYPTFQLQAGKRYRFRLICAATTFNFLVTFDGHPMKVINTDGNRVHPVTVDYLHMYSGERYDVIIEANQPPGNYWLRASLPDETNEVRAILTYSTEAVALPATEPIREKTLNLTAMTSFSDMPNYQRTITIDVSEVEDLLNPGQRWAMNGVIFEHPTQPLFQDPELSPRTLTYTLNNMENVLFVLRNLDADDPHPFHLHGHTFWLAGMGNNHSEINETLFATQNPVQKDTFTIPASGWVAVVIQAKNPGYWLFHCHVEWHMSSGMAVLLISNPTDLPKLPKNFPTCYPFPNDNPPPGDWGCPEEQTAVITGLAVAFSLVSAALVGLIIAIWVRSRQTAGDPLQFHSSKNHPIELD